MISTQESYRRMAEFCSKKEQYEFIISEMNKISERKTKKKCDVIFLENLIRKLIKGI